MFALSDDEADGPDGERLVDLSEGATVAIKRTEGSLCVYLGPIHMILDRL